MSDYKEGDRLRLKHKTDGSEMIGYYRRFSGFDGGFYGPSLILDDEIKHAMVVEKLLEGGKWELEVLESAPEPLPTEPGTVIAIGDWWLVRLRAYETTRDSAWELLPMSTKYATENAERNGVKTQCVYGDAWVQAEVRQEGGFKIISKPVTS